MVVSVAGAGFWLAVMSWRWGWVWVSCAGMFGWFGVWCKAVVCEVVGFALQDVMPDGRSGRRRVDGRIGCRCRVQVGGDATAAQVGVGESCGDAWLVRGLVSGGRFAVGPGVVCQDVLNAVGHCRARAVQCGLNRPKRYG
ncbi:hypothetical protein Acsp03_43970 [Actinomadura sp. NBRC 104412]|nr:hypothetical protein Acsp03_43970 [Actinomadura sp. NBRC 104412]